MVLRAFFFQAADLGLGDVDLGGNLHLGFALKKTETDDAVFTVVEPLHGVA